jgi:hypothetical protein
MGTMLVTGSSVEEFDRSSAEDFARALEEAVKQGPQSSSAHRTYEIRRAWFQSGGVVGKRIYYLEVEISGSDVRPNG